MRKWIMALLVVCLLSACTAKEEENKGKEVDEKETDLTYLVKTEDLILEHVHGIGYNLENELLVATHSGIKINRDGTWYETSQNLHDYMGFQITEDGFYVSGHPEEGANLKNPLGIMKGTEYGEKLEKIQFYGESDFHFLGASFSDSDLYVINEQPNSIMEQGFYRSTDGGQSWTQPEMDGFDADTFGMIAVHPTNGDTVAMATRDGIYGSFDGGETFTKWTDGMITAVVFTDEQLYYSTVSSEGSIGLNRYNFETQQSEPIPIPFLDFDNPIIYLAVSPSDAKIVTIVTYDLDILQSSDMGENWKPLLQDGKL